jgi:hypothetical protein
LTTRGGLGREPDALEVGVDHLIPGLFVDIERRSRRGHAGVVDEHRHGAESRLCVVETPFDPRGIGDVENEGLCSFGSDDSNRLGQRLGPASAERHHGARVGQHSGEMTAETAGGSRHQSMFAAEIEQPRHS